jgi:hypothetical protein
MERTGGSILGGIGGAAILGMLLVSTPRVTKSVSSPSLSEAAGSWTAGTLANNATLPITLDNSGPWYALCREYAGSDYEREDEYPTSSGRERGVRKFTAPPNIEDNSTEITTKIGEAQHKVPVTTHLVGDLPSCVQGDSSEFQILIATVPDPVNSHLELEFDRVIEALQHAAASAGYDFERYWFPWFTRGMTPAANSSATMDSSYRRRREQQPGLLIFRGHPSSNSEAGVDQETRPQSKKLLIFLVAETPTFGLNRTALAQALWYRHQLARYTQSRQVSIIGPQFSATYASLGDVLIDPASDPVIELPLQVLSPTTSAGPLIAAFREKMVGKKGEENFSFESLELPYQEASKRLIEELRRIGYSDGEIAIVGEDESAYGAELRDSPSPTRILKLQYPRELSALRNASEAQSSSLSDSDHPIVPSNSLPLSLHEPATSERDSPPPFASDQHPVDTDRALQELTRQLRQNHIQAVILLTTNPLDRIYLLDYLHRTLPDVRLAVFDPDEFMLGRPKFVDLSGTLTVSGLPLLVDNEVYLPRSNAPQIITFPSTRAEGEYLAATTLLVNPHWYLNGPSGLKDCAAITIVGKNGFQIAASKSPQVYPCTNDRDTVILRRGSTELPWAWSVAQILLLVGAAVHLFFLLYSRFREATWVPCSYVLVKGSAQKEQKRFYLFVVSNQLLLLEFLFASIGFVLHTMSMSLWQTSLYRMHSVLLFGVTSVSIYLAFEVAKSSLDRGLKPAMDKVQKKFLLWMLPLSALYVISTAWTWLIILGNGQALGWSETVAIRSARLLDGLSPLTPIAIILLGYILWGFTQLIRLSQVESRKVHLDIPTEDNKSAQTLSRQQAELHSSIEQVVDPMVPTLVVPLTSVIIFTLFRLWPSLRGIDPPVFRTWLAVWGFGAFLITIGSGFYRAWNIWRYIHQILRFIEGTPLRSAFSRIPKELSTMRIWRMGGGGRSFLLQMRTIEVLDRIEHLQPTPAAVIAAATPAVAAAAAGTAATATAETLSTAAAVAANSTTAPLVANTSNAATDGTGNSTPQHRCDTSSLEAARTQLLEIVALDNAHRVPSPAQVNELSKRLNYRWKDVTCFLHHERFLPGNDVGTKKINAMLELYAAYRILSLVRYSMIQLRNLILFVIYGYAFLVICLSVYPFQGRRALGNLLSIAFLGLLVGISAILVQMDRDGILSRLDNTEAGRASLFSVGLRLLSVGGVPLLAVAASQFPAMAEFLGSWVRPMLEAAR